MTTPLEIYNVFVNLLYEPLAAQDDVGHLGKTAESLIMEFDRAKLEEPCA